MIHTFAAIYIGSYEVSIKIFEISGKKKIRDIDYIRSRIELGRDAYSKGSIGYELVEALCDTLAEYKKIMDGYRVDSYEAYAATFFCCTSCVQRGRLKERAGDIRTFRYFNNTDVCTYESDCKCINRYRVVCRYTHNIIINRVFRIKSYWDLFAYQSSRFRTSFREQPCLKAIAFKSSNSGFSWFT